LTTINVTTQLYNVATQTWRRCILYH